MKVPFVVTTEDTVVFAESVTAVVSPADEDI